MSKLSGMDDVDRLFACFKCGISPPESAMRERKSSRSRLSHDNSSLDRTNCPDSVGEGKIRTPNSTLRLEKLGSVTDRANKVTGSKQISPVVFYGSPLGVPPKRPSSLLRLLREIHIDLAGRRKSNLRNQIWATFPKQDEAVKFAKEQTNVRIFSYQDHFTGQRRFLVSTYQEFWRRYKNMNPSYRHHYEVIQEALPCHLYFDLEFSRLENTEKNGDQMVDILLSVIFEVLYEKYQLQGELDWVVELDSSTQAKFSRHLVLRIPEAAFKDNSHAGAFVSEVCSRIHSAGDKDAKYQQLFISKDSSSAEPSAQLFVDNAVYTRNRCFRLALSSKAGKTSVLLPSGRFKCKNMSEEDVFMASLICNIDDDCKKLLVCKMELDCMKTLQFETEVKLNCRASTSVLQRFTSRAFGSENSKTYHTGTSPFPALDAFIESVASFGPVPGKMRSWYWFSEDELLVYSMSQSRYCERIGREHKSNHVMYVVDLQWALFYQKCYDPDCRGYRSPSRQVPEGVIPEISTISHTGESESSVDSKVVCGDNDQKHGSLCYDESMLETDMNEEWWLEAIKAAENVESMGILHSTNMNSVAYEDDEWWMEVERIASQAELNCHG